MWIEVSVKVALVVVVAWFATFLLRRASADVRHLIWLTALLSLPLLAIPLPVLIETPGSSFAFTQNAVVQKLTGAGVGNAAWARYLPGIVWFAGVLVAGLRIGRSVSRLSRITRKSREFDGPAVRLSDDVRVSDDIATPCTWGVLNPVILLPPYAAEWSAENREWAIRHERAHVERRDWFWQTVARAIKALFWFHPLVWFAANRLRKEAEHAADDRVLASGAEAAGYAGQLLDVARRVRTSGVVEGVALDGIAMVRTSMIEYRIRAIVDPLVPRSTAGLRTKLMVGASALAVAMTVAASSTSTVHRIGEKGITAPSVIRTIEPDYTQEARDAKLAGTVVLSVVIDEQGRAENVTVRRSLGRGLDQNAVEAIRKWKFKPAEKNGKPVRVYATIEVNFKMI